MEERYKVCLACTSTAIEGCENMSAEEAQNFLWENDVTEPIETECGDTHKYVVLSVNMDPNQNYKE